MESDQRYEIALNEPDAGTGPCRTLIPVEADR
jgi:hypothetical protein